MKSNAYSVSVVVPVFNGAQTLPELTTRLRAVLSNQTVAYEVIFVNDGSRDDSWQVIQALVATDPAVRGLDLMHNYGQHNALLAGIMKAQHDIIVTIDDDLQNPPEELPKLLEALLEDNNDVVYGKALMRKHSAWRNLGSKLVKTGLRVALGAELGDKSSAFRVFRAELRRGFERFADAKLSIDVLLSWSANRVGCVTVEHKSRQIGQSGYNLGKLLGLTMSMVTGYSTVPLRLASSVGFVAAMVGFVTFLYVIIRRLLQESYVPGFAFISAEIAFFAGIQLLTIGIIGEYLARIHFRTMGMPAYVVRTELPDFVKNIKEIKHN